MRPALLLPALLATACAPRSGVEGPPAPAAGLPAFDGATVTAYGTADDPDAFGPATARIEGNTFYILADDRPMSLFSRRISYDPGARRLSSAHRDLDLVHSDGAFRGTLRDPATRQKRTVIVAVPESALP